MSARTPRFTLLKLAKLAKVAHKVAYEARDRGVLHPDVLAPSDVLPLRTFDALRRITWSGERQARFEVQRLRLWESLAIEKSRMELAGLDPLTGLYVHPKGAELASRASDHAIHVLLLAEEGLPHHYLPLGSWAADALETLGQGEQVLFDRPSASDAA
ncbi:hypothetical protein ACFV9E_03450 [Streptomyces sp. NPDC059835]|uniref:hypothetical protein n=1 Tax=Streptomyces sp. NPDC059835 TaxID=3346967 RepID=UPI0036473A07